ncbi:MAG: hypothetical protein R3C45_07455 [Phycisphaerales bacterium]
MNPKDSGFFQKNIEKLVLGVSALLLLGAAYYFLLGNPFPVEVSGRAIGPTEIKDRVQARVNQLDNQLDSPDSALPDRPIPAYSEAFVEDMAEKPTTMAALMPLAQAGLSSEVVPDDGNELPTFSLPRPPIAENILTRKGHAVLSDNIPTRQMQDLIRLVGNNEPKDFTYVSVAATFDMDEWIERLQSGDKETRVPPRWWNSMIGISGVMLQRQELDETTGEWGNETYIDPIPGQVAFKPSSTFQATNQQSKEAIMMVRANQETIARPDFPLTRGNILWSPPNEEAQELDAEGQRKLARINSQIATYKDQIARLQEQIIKESEVAARRDATSQATPDRTRRAPAPRGGVGGDPGGYGSEQGGGGRAARPQRGAGARTAEAPQTPQDRLNLLQQQLIDAKLQRDELLGIQSDVLSQSGYEGGMGMGGYGGYGEEGGFGEMGGYGGMGGYGAPQGGYGGGYGAMDPYGGPGAYGGAQGGYGATPGVTDPTQAQTRKIQVWAHDLTIEPGKTYRYRVVVAVLNPLYRQKRVADAQREEHYDRISLGPDPQELASSPWSDPVHVDSDYYFFMLKGTSQSARVEVWQVYDGKWVNQEFEVRPGDPIGQPVNTTVGNRQLQLDMNVGLVVVDLIQAAGGGSFGGGDLRMLYLNPDNNRIVERSIEQDRNDPDWTRLKNEQALQAELALSPATPDPAAGRF